MDSPLSLVPAPGEGIDWAKIERSFLGSVLREMQSTPQDALWHGEGNVYAHTKRVCECLNGMRAFGEMERPRRQMLFLAALLHDVGKPYCTRAEAGRIVSPRHGVIGAGVCRALLWREGGLCGAPETMRLRESVCALVAGHTKPLHLLEKPNPALEAVRLAAPGELAQYYSLEALALLAEADIRGRVCPDREVLLEALELFRMQAREANCYAAPLVFPDGYSRWACLAGKNVAPGQALYDGCWGEVLLLCGLPGTGKDSWLRARYPSLKTISLDEIRREMRVSPRDNQGRVLARARQEAAECLRAHVPFAWNATSLTYRLRQNQLSLFARYGARGRVVYLETGWEEQMRRNQSRAAAVPQPVIENMLARLAPPLPDEAPAVQWECV